MLAALAYACLQLALPAHGAYRWVVLAMLAYGILAVPPLIWFTLHVRWNAPEAERRNRSS